MRSRRPHGVLDSLATYFYNADRQVDSLLRPDSIAVRFGYNTAGRPSTVQFDRGTLGFSYSAASGHLTRITAPGNDTLLLTYDGSLPTKVVWAGDLPSNSLSRCDGRNLHPAGLPRSERSGTHGVAAGSGPGRATRRGRERPFRPGPRRPHGLSHVSPP